MTQRVEPTGPSFDPYNITRGRDRRPRDYTPPPFIFEHSVSFRARVLVPDDDGACWLWTSTVRSDGQAFFRARGKLIPIRKFAYLYHVGPVPEGMVVRAACEVVQCVTPLHLYLRPMNQHPNDIGSEMRANLRIMHHDHGHPLSWLAEHYGLSRTTVARAVHDHDA